MKVVIVDDHRMIREALVVLLSRAGIDVLGAFANGGDAIVGATHLRPDAVIMDVTVAREASRQLRAAIPGIKIVALSLHLDHHALAQKTGSARRPGEPRGRSLTERERSVLELLALGRSSKEIACALCIAVPTVETHRRQIMDKLGLRTIAQLTKYAIREGLTSVDA